MSNKIRKYKMSGYLQASVLPDSDVDPNGHAAYKKAQLVLDEICSLKDNSAFLPFGVFIRAYGFQGEELTLDYEADSGDITLIPTSDFQLEKLLSILESEYGYEISS